MNTVREAPLPGRFIETNQTVAFTFDGRTIQGRAGQSIAAALFAAGVRIFSRSFKYHRPRGLFCVSGDCPNCLMNVDGRPNVRTCIEPVRDGQIVTHQNAWPSLNWDVLRTFDYFDYFLPVGFYYKRFHKPRWLWPVFERMVRHIAGLGKIDTGVIPASDAEVEHVHTDVCVVGGGVAGTAAAEAAARTGAKVVLLERMHRLGGVGLFETDDEVMAESELAGLGVRVLTNAPVFGLYEGNLIGACQADRLLKIRAKQIIVCTGGRQRPFVFHNNDLPGIMLSRGVLRLGRLFGVRAGQRAVVVTDSDEGGLAADRIKKLGIDVAALVDARPGSRDGVDRGFPHITGSIILEGVGSSHLRAVRVAQVDETGRIQENTIQEIACDLLCMASRAEPANELLLQAGMRLRFADGRWLPARDVPGLAAAGSVTGTPSGNVAARRSEGRLRGAEAARVLGFAVPDFDRYQADWSAAQPAAAAAATRIFPQGGAGQRKRFVCLCEDVTEKDIGQAMAEGFDNIETLKRYSTANMGPCQGKMCSHNVVEICARLSGRDVNAVGTTTSRPPAVAVDMCVLAADRHHHPVRRTPLHHWHEAAGATWLDAGLWKRPERYGDPAGEVRAVRYQAGLVDVSTLGKIELIGPDAAELLDRIYINRWSDLKPGRARYGVMCNEDGILFDDGVGIRRDTNCYYLTATTGNAEAVWQWLEMWRATWGLRVTIVNQTAGLAAMNLAGPRARDILSRLTTLDLALAAFPYMTWRDGNVAGVPCLLLRIGFVGELGYEIHCPSAATEHLWTALHQAGQEFGLRPFGVEAQRILRLEKGHIILGVDTDALSNPLEAGLESMVRFEKPAFHGREPLLRFKARGPRSRLVGFHLRDAGPNDLRDLEGCQIVEAGRPVGRVTSARYSPTLEKALGLAWIPAARSTPGQAFKIRCEGRDLAAAVVALPFYDPDMQRQKA